MLSFDNYIHVYCGVFVGIRSIYLFKQKKNNDNIGFKYYFH